MTTPPPQIEVVRAIGWRQTDGYVRPRILQYALMVASLPPREVWLVQRDNVDDSYWLMYEGRALPCANLETGTMGLHMGVTP